MNWIGIKKKTYRIFINDINYKIIAALITIILWLTILGRRDLVLTKKISVDYILPPQYKFVSTPLNSLKVELTGPRRALQKFSQNSQNQIITFDLKDTPLGKIKLKITKDKLQIPLGVKILSIIPEKINLIIKQVPLPSNDNSFLPKNSNEEERE